MDKSYITLIDQEQVDLKKHIDSIVMNLDEEYVMEEVEYTYVPPHGLDSKYSEDDYYDYELWFEDLVNEDIEPCVFIDHIKDDYSDPDEFMDWGMNFYRKEDAKRNEKLLDEINSKNEKILKDFADKWGIDNFSYYREWFKSVVSGENTDKDMIKEVEDDFKCRPYGGYFEDAREFVSNGLHIYYTFTKDEIDVFIRKNWGKNK